MQRIPVVRILIPFVLGIFTASKTGGTFWVPLIVCIVSAAAYLVIHFYARTSLNAQMNARSLYYIPLFFIAFSLGFTSELISRPEKIDFDTINGRQVQYKIDQIRYGDFSMQISATIVGSDSPHETGGKVWLTTRGCNYRFLPGQVICCEADIEDMKRSGNPYDFDFADYLRDNGIVYSQHVHVDSMRVCGEMNDFFSVLERQKLNLSHKILNTNISSETQALLIALLLGNRAYLSHELRQDFSNSGIAHLLALSGLHIGIIALILWFILYPLELCRLRWLRFTITMACLVLFDIITGLSPSVVRATVLIAFVFASFLVQRRYNPLNSLLSAALLILVFAPNSIYNAGFQLSFVTVASILVFSPNIKVKNRFVNYFLTLVITSVIASLSSFMIIAHYFHTIPHFTILTNIVVLPVFPIILTLSVIILIFLAIGVDVAAVGWLLDKTYGVLTSFAHQMASMPFSHTQYVSVSNAELAAYYLLLFFFAYWLHHKSAKWLIAMGVCAISIPVSSVIEHRDIPSHGLIVLNSHNSTPIVYYQNHQAFLWMPDVEKEDIDIDKFCYQHNGLISHLGITNVKCVPPDSLLRINPEADFISHNQFAYLCGNHIMILGRGKWRNYDNPLKSPIDIAIVTKNFNGDIARIVNQFHIKQIVLSGDIYRTKLDKLVNECNSCSISCFSIKKSGAFQIP